MATELPDLGQANSAIRDFCIAVKQEMDSLQREVASLASRLSAIEHDHPLAISDIAPRERQLSVKVPNIAAVSRLTAEMFSILEIGFEYDPAEPEVEWVAFTVTVDVEPREGVQKHIEWHERIAQLEPPVVGDFRLMIVPSQ